MAICNDGVMVRTVKKGHRRFSPPIIGLNFSNIAVYKCNFGNSWRYKPNWENDWSKLFGWSFGLLPVKIGDKWVPAHQYNSIRAAVRYIPVIDCMEIALYTYAMGSRIVIEPNIYVPLNTDVIIELFTDPSDLKGLVKANLKVTCGNLIREIGSGAFEDKVGYLTGTYFGGHDADKGIETPAPHDIVFKMKKIV